MDTCILRYRMLLARSIEVYMSKRLGGTPRRPIWMKSGATFNINIYFITVAPIKFELYF